jgi:hypothetical protein
MMTERGFVYVIGTAWTEPFKIGVANNVERRLEALQSGNPLQLSILWQSSKVLDHFQFEADLHARFGAFRIRGEWFLVPDAGPALFDEAADTFQATARKPRKGVQHETCAVCVAAVRGMIDELQHGTSRLTIEDAIGVIAARTGLGRSAVWRLHYRPPTDVSISTYEAIIRAVWEEKGLPSFQHYDIPMPDEVEGVLAGKPARQRKSKPPLSLEEMTSLTDQLIQVRHALAVEQAEALVGAQEGEEAA